MAIDTTVILAAALGGGGFSALLATFRWAWERWAKRRALARSMPLTVQRIHNIYGALNALQSATGADRALLLRAHNGGAIPRPGVALYSSVIYEVHATGVASIRDSWQKQPLDEHYIGLLLKVATQKIAALETKRMYECALRDAYESLGVTESRIAEVKSGVGEYYYLSLSWSDDIARDDAFVNMQIRTATARILDNLNEEA